MASKIVPGNIYGKYHKAGKYNSYKVFIDKLIEINKKLT
jgi:hypothetical protein